MFKGIYTALITPFKKGSIDYKAFESLVNWQIESGVNGLVVAGTTGEGQSITKEEFLRLVELAVKIAKGRVAIIANTGSISTLDSIALTKAAQELKVDGVMVVTPYYIKPTQEGIYQHFKAIHDASKLPILMYNAPGRSCVDITNETIIRLAALPRIKAIKDCSANPIKCTQLKLKLDDQFIIMCGDDALTLPYYSQGAEGVVSVTANIVPSLIVKLHNLWHENNIKEAMALQSILLPLNEVLFCETNPVPVKYVASIFELCSEEVRLPLVGLTKESKETVQQILEELKEKLYGKAN